MQNQLMSIKPEHIKNQLSNKFRNIIIYLFSFYFPIITKKHNIINNHSFVRKA